MATSLDRVRGVSPNVAIKAPVRVATTANITLSGEQTIDGVAVVDGDRVLVKDQSTASENGIYEVDTGTWTRAIDFNSDRDFVQGTEVLTLSGTINVGKRFFLSTSSPAIGGSLAFSEITFSGLGDAATGDLGVEVQAYDAGLASIAGLTTAANKMIYTTAPDTYAVATFTAAGRALLDDADASAQRTTLGLGNIATTDLIDEDDMSSDTAEQAPTQQSVKAYTDAQVAAYALGVGQTWQDVSGSRSVATSYQNTTGRPIMVAIRVLNASAIQYVRVSSDGATWINVGASDSGNGLVTNFVVPDNWYYQVTQSSGTTTTPTWSELR